MKNKSEALDKFKYYIYVVKIQKETKKVLYNDRGGEYFSLEFDASCPSKNACYTPQ